jgi:hypothetical protein
MIQRQSCYVFGNWQQLIWPPLLEKSGEGKPK